MGGVDPQGLSGFLGRHIHLSLQISPAWPGRSEKAHQGDCRDTHALWIQTRASASAAGGLNEGTTVKIDLKHVVRDIDRHGNDRFYFRVKDQQKVRLPGIPGSEEFMETYQEPLKRQTAKIGGLRHVSEGSFAWLCHIYFNSTTFKVELAPLTRAMRRRILVNLHPAIGDKPFAKIEARHVRVWLDDRADRPEAANGLLKALRALFKFPIDRGIAKRNPVAEISKIKTKTDGHHTWTVSEAHQFEERHPIGSVARLAMALLLYTGSRRGDVVLPGRQHIRDGWLGCGLIKAQPQSDGGEFCESQIG
jgi:hypothetical protein